MKKGTMYYLMQKRDMEILPDEEKSSTILNYNSTNTTTATAADGLPEEEGGGRVWTDIIIIQDEIKKNYQSK